jgi:hypothetical protein
VSTSYRLYGQEYIRLQGYKASEFGQGGCLCNGADLNNINKKGRTHLMQASLWGRIQVVDFLLSQHVNTQLQDCKGNTALDLAHPNRKSLMERHGYPEKSDADMCRRIIACKLIPYISERTESGSRGNIEARRTRRVYQDVVGF